MRCPFCRFTDSRVIDSREIEDGVASRRRRSCPECGRRFTTVEEASLTVVKRSGTDIFINIPKLVLGVMPWSEPPSRVVMQAKLGSPADGVDKLYGSRSPSVYEETS